MDTRVLRSSRQKVVATLNGWSGAWHWPSWSLPAVAAVAACLVALRGGHVDYDVYVRAGHRVLRAQDLYSTHGELPFTYPPFAALVAVVFAIVPLLWLAVLSILTMGAAAWPTARVLRQANWSRSRIAILVSLAICSEPVLRNLDLGQINGLVLGLVLADVLLLPPRWRGVLVGLAAGIKLTPFVLLLHFGVRREWSAVARCLAGFGATVGVGFLALPSASLQFWSGLVAAPERVGNPGFIDNQSIRGLVERLDLAPLGRVARGVGRRRGRGRPGSRAPARSRPTGVGARVPPRRDAGLPNLLVPPLDRGACLGGRAPRPRWRDALSCLARSWCTRLERVRRRSALVGPQS